MVHKVIIVSVRVLYFGFLVFRFSGFRVFGFSGFRVFGFLGFRVFRFSGFWFSGFLDRTGRQVFGRDGTGRDAELDNIVEITNQFSE